MILQLEIEPGQFADAAEFDIVRVVVSDGDLIRRRLGDQQHQFSETRLEFADAVFDLLELLLDLGHPGDGGGLVVALELGDLLAGRLLVGSKVLELTLQVAQFPVDGQQVGHVEPDAFDLGGPGEQVGILTDALYVNHVSVTGFLKGRRKDTTWAVRRQDQTDLRHGW